MEAHLRLPPGWTRERLGVAYYYRVGFTPAGRYVTHSLPASADSLLSPPSRS